MRSITREALRQYGQETREGFSTYFEARKKRQAERRTWAANLPGGEQAQQEHRARMKGIQARKEARDKARQDSAAGELAWGSSFTGAEQARAQHEQRMKDIETRRLQRSEARKDSRAQQAFWESDFTGAW